MRYFYLAIAIISALKVLYKIYFKKELTNLTKVLLCFLFVLFLFF